MSNRTYICEDCRASQRAEASRGHKTSLRCPGCRQPLWELSHKYRIPPKSDDKAWRELAIAVKASRKIWDARRDRIGTKLLSETDTRIAEISRLKESDLRTDFLKDLLKNRNDVLKKYFDDEG